MSGFDRCTPRNEIVRPRYFQNRIIMFCLPVFTFMYLWAIYTLPPSDCSRIHECRNWERGRAVSFLRIYVSNFWYSVQVQASEEIGPLSVSQYAQEEREAKRIDESYRTGLLCPSQFTGWEVWAQWVDSRYPVIRFVSISAKFGICTVVGL